LQVTAGRSRRQERPSSLSTARPFLFSPSLLLVYPPTASLAKVRAGGLSRDFSNPAKFPSMGNFKNRLTATQPPNRVAPSQESRPSSKTAPCSQASVAPSLPTRVIFAYPVLGKHHPPGFSFFNLGRAFPMKVGRAFLNILAYPALSRHPPQNTNVQLMLFLFPFTQIRFDLRTYLYLPFFFFLSPSFLKRLVPSFLILLLSSASYILGKYPYYYTLPLHNEKTKNRKEKKRKDGKERGKQGRGETK